MRPQFAHNYTMFRTTKILVEGTGIFIGYVRTQDMKTHKAFTHEYSVIECSKNLFVNIWFDDKPVDDSLNVVLYLFV